MKPLLITLPLIVLILSCEKDPPVVNPPERFESTDFPVEVGNWWEYTVTDFLSGTEDTLKIEVVNKTMDDDYFCYLSQNGLIVDSAIIELTNEKFKYVGLNTDYSYFGDLYLEFPLQIGTSFNTIGIDSVYVVSYVEDKIIAGNRYDIYNLKRESVSPGFSIVQTMSISEGVGIVEQTYNLFNTFPVQHQKFKLINYYINE